MDKVLVEITAVGWTTSVYYKGKVYEEVYLREHNAAGKLVTRCIDGNLDAEKDLPYDLVQQVVKLTEFNVMEALGKINKID